MSDTNLRQTTQTVNRKTLFVIGLIYLALAVSHYFVIADPHHQQLLVGLASGSCLISLLIAIYMGRTNKDLGTVSEGFYIMLFGMNTFAHMWLTQDILQTTNVILIIMLIGGGCNDRRLYFSALGGYLLIWALLFISLDAGEGLKIHLLFAMILSVAASLAMFKHRFGILNLLSQQQQEKDQLANYDLLTQCLRRDAFDRRSRTLIEQANGSRSDVGMVFCDLDYFKRLNDLRGHAAGAEALKLVGALLNEVAAKYQVLNGRMGGEEFALLGLLDRQQVMVMAHEIRSDIEALKFRHPDSPISQYLTVSVGVSHCQGSHFNDPSQLFTIADKALYQAKDAGRNRVAQLNCCTPMVA